MKAKIHVTGGTSGFLLTAKLWQEGCTETALPFNGVAIAYGSVKEAREALRRAYNELKGKSRTQYIRRVGKLLYDTSEAQLIK
jgi:hypothetical protein